MGGFGSGRTAGFAWHPTVDELLPLDVRALHRAGVLRPGTRSRWAWRQGDHERGAVMLLPQEDSIVLSYQVRHSSGPSSCDIRDSVSLERTPCHIAGDRVWFR